MTNQKPAAQKSETSVLVIIWLALAQSHIIFGLISYFVLAKSSQGVFDVGTSYALVGVALSCGLVAFLLFKKASKLADRRNLSSQQQGGEATQQQSFSLFICSWAICETVSINGLLMVSLLGPKALPTATALFISGLGLHLLLRPRNSQKTR